MVLSVTSRVGIVSWATAPSEQRPVDVRVSVKADVLGEQVVGLKPGQVTVPIVGARKV